MMSLTWPFACVSMHPHSRSILEVTLLNVLEPLDANVGRHNLTTVM